MDATRLLFILREGWAEGERDRKRGIRVLPVPIECDQATQRRVEEEATRRYGIDDMAARDAFSDGYLCGLTDDRYALADAKNAILTAHACQRR